MSPAGLSRRRLLAIAAAAGGALVLPFPPTAAGGKAPDAGGGDGDTGAPAVESQPVLGRTPANDPVAGVYHEALLLHTRWVQQQWDSAIGAYRNADFRFASVLGNAVLLAVPGFDAAKAGVDRGTLRRRTIATIKRYASTNRLAGGTDWGRQLFWDSTFELYLVLAARLLWSALDDRTRLDIQSITIGQAAYAYELGTGDDPMSPGDSPNGSRGGWIGATKLPEMNVYAQALAPGIAWTEGDGWRDRFESWIANASGLPSADRANPVLASRNTAHNIHDTFIVERDGSADPYEQADLWRTAARCAIHFLTAGQPLPPILTAQPSARELWSTLMLLASDAGEPVMPMNAGHYHGYGRDVLSLAYLAQIQGDGYAARAETDLAARLLPYLAYAPANRLTKFGVDDRYESSARAELAVAYLLHRHRVDPVKPVPSAEFFAAAQGTRDFGDDVGMVVHQSPNAFAAAVTKKGYVNFLWQPGHDNWLVDSRATAFLPPSAGPPKRFWTHAYQKVRDGVDATATVLDFGDQYAAFTTLPTGTVVYASTGIGADEGGLTLFNLAMPGVAGLAGNRTFTGASGVFRMDGSRGGGGDGGVDELGFPPRQARYVRMLGKQAAGQYGYSIWTFSVFDTAGADLAQGATATGSSEDVTYPAYNATDGNPHTRWAVARDRRDVVGSWLAVDLGSTVTVAGVRIAWEGAYATRYVIQTSTDARIWTDAVSVPDARTLTGGWVDIDGRAGLVTQESYRPIRVTATGVVAAAGPPASSTVEGYARPIDLAAAANRTLPMTTSGLRVNDADGYLSVFNLSADPVTDAVVSLPSAGRLYLGTQTVRADGLDWTVSQPPATARVEPPRFTVEGPAPEGTYYEVTDSRHVTVMAPARRTVAVTLRSGSWSKAVRVPAGSECRVVVQGGVLTPAADLARGRTTFPTSPLPAGMTSPGRAVDGDPRTAWRPGPSGRMVVDLGSVHDLASVRSTWTGGWVAPVLLESSTDGLTYASLDLLPGGAPLMTTEVTVPARYLAITVLGWRPGDAELIELAVNPDG